MEFSVDLPSTWQDWVLSVGQLVFFLALIPSIVSADKPSPWTSIMTAVLLTAFVVVFWSLSLTYAALTSALVAAEWYVLFFQKVFEKKSASNTEADSRESEA